MTEMYSGLHVGQRFASLEDFKALVRNISVRQHWELRVTRSNKKSVVIGCRSSNNCFFRVVCRANKNSTYISSLQDSHSCRRSTASTSRTPTRSEVSHVRFLMNEIPKLFDVRESIKAQEVVEAVKRCHGYDISMRQAQRALIRLQQEHHPGQLQEQDEGDDEHEPPDSHQPPSEGPGESSNYSGSGLSGQRWVPDLQAGLVDPNSLPQGDLPRGSTIPTSQLHGGGIPAQPPMPHSHHGQPTPQILHTPEMPAHDPTTFGHPVHPRANQQQAPYGVPNPNHPPPVPPPAAAAAPPPPTHTARSHPQGPVPGSGHPAASHLVLTNFKIEFTCTTCGALNQSFFPNQGNVTGGSYLSAHAVSEPTAVARGTGPLTQVVPGHHGERVDDSHGYGGDNSGHARGVQSSWAAGTLDVPIAPAHT